MQTTSDDRTFEFRQWVEEIDEAGEEILNDFERSFLVTVRDRLECFKALSPRMIEVLQQLYVKSGMADELKRQTAMVRECWAAKDFVLSGWEANEFLPSLHGRVMERKWLLTTNQLVHLEEIHRKVQHGEREG